MAAFFGANDIWSRHDDESNEPVILAGVWETGGLPAGRRNTGADIMAKEMTGGAGNRGALEGYSSEEEFFHSLDELGELAKACRMKPVGRVTQQMARINPGLYVGTGKAEEIRELAEANEARRVIFNDTLSPSQIRNLQKILKLPVMDRTALILEIFERRARTREAKLQVELAKLRYLKPRLIGLWETQNRQGGTSGAMSTKGEGETQLEIDRRTIDHRLTELGRELKVVSRERETQRKKRQGSGLPLVALVGYTNAGKSTIMNAMIDRYIGGEADRPAVTETAQPLNEKAEARKVFEADMLFATLDTTVRRISVERGREFLLSDTVGFIHKLPTALVEAFKSTLEEVTEADLLLQVVDGSDPHCREHIAVTNETIAELGAGHIPMITVFNKADLVEPPVVYPRSGIRQESAAEFRNENIYISAKQPESVEYLVQAVFEKLDSKKVTRTFVIPYQKGQVVSYLMENGVVLGTEYTGEGTELTVTCEPEIADRADKMLR